MITNEQFLPPPRCRPLSRTMEEKSSCDHSDSARSSLVHNHPSGDPAPSQADVEMTRQVAQVARTLGIQVLDHVIVGNDGYASLKGLKLIEQPQYSGDRRGWLEALFSVCTEAALALATTFSSLTRDDMYSNRHLASGYWCEERDTPSRLR